MKSQTRVRNTEYVWQSQKSVAPKKYDLNTFTNSGHYNFTDMYENKCPE